MISTKLKFIFYVLCFLTISGPITIALIQAYFVNHEISYDVTILSNWVYATDTFALPIEVFKMLVAITTVLGLYYKISQTERQISQLELRDTFAMHIEHRNYILEALDDNLGAISNETILCVQRSKFYISMFPENEPTKMESYDFIAKGPPIEFPNFISVLDEVCHLVEVKSESPSNKHVEYWIGKIGQDFDPFGFSFKPIEFSPFELVKVIEVSSCLIEVLNFYSVLNSRAVEVKIKYFNAFIKDMIISPYDKQGF